LVSRQEWYGHASKPYAEVEPLFLWLIASKASKWIRKLGGDGSINTLDDFKQEGRIAAAQMWNAYDPQQGSFTSYLGMALDNNFKGLLDRELATTRCPQNVAGDGTRHPMRPTSLNVECGDGRTLADYVADPTPCPETILNSSDAVGDLLATVVIVKSKLTERQKLVFSCLYERNEGFWRHVRATGKSPTKAYKQDIATYLEVDVAVVDSDSSRIRRLLRAHRG